MSKEEKTLVNRVANSGLITLNLEDHYPTATITSLDIKEFLFKELILKEKDFRASLKEIDWSQYQDHVLLVHCSTDAIIPVWAYMLISTLAAPYVKEIYQGDNESYLRDHYEKVLRSRDYKSFEQQRIVIKGCSNKPVPASAYATLAALLQPFAQSIMYGEPCSTVPIFKRPRVINKEK